MHTLPLTVRVAGVARVGTGIDRPSMELRGSGSLTDRRTDHLTVHHRAVTETSFGVRVDQLVVAGSRPRVDRSVAHRLTLDWQPALPGPGPEPGHDQRDE